MGTTGISENQVLQHFMVTPTDMEMSMQMVGAMFAPTRNLTLFKSFVVHLSWVRTLFVLEGD